MRFSINNARRYGDSRVEEIDSRQNLELTRELSSGIVPRDPRGGGGRGGGGGSSGGSRGGSSGGGSSSGGSSGGGSSSGGSRGGVSFGGGTSSRGSSSYSSGGGSSTVIASGAFAGRSVGGGTRDQVYGGSRYGSGYPAGGGSYVAGRNFPFGYWPVYVPVGGGAAYYGYREYGPVGNSSRPGGAMSQALVRHTSWPTANARRWLESRQSSNSTNSTTPAQVNNATASYYIVGDADTVSAVMQELVTACSVVSTTAVPVNESNPMVHYEQAVQFYRASSFMLALTSYNNSANLPSNAPANNSVDALPKGADTPLPAGTDMNFLNCLNTTIGASIPIMDAVSTASSSAAPAPLQAFGGLNIIGLVWVMLWLLKVL